jgi:hypothetical protein
MRAKPSAVTKAKKFFETTGLPATQIGPMVGLSGATVLRYAKARNWRRPDTASAAATRSKRPKEAKAKPAPRRARKAPASGPEIAIFRSAAPAPALSAAERCRELLLRVLAAAEGHIAVFEQRLAAPKIDMAGREKEVRVIAVLTRLVNDINHVLGTAAQVAPGSEALSEDGADDVAHSPDRARQEFSDRLDALLGGDPAGGFSAAFPVDA